MRSLKASKLLIFLDAQNAENGEIAPNWNVSGTRDFSFADEIPIPAFPQVSELRQSAQEPHHEFPQHSRNVAKVEHMSEVRPKGARLR